MTTATPVAVYATSPGSSQSASYPTGIGGGNFLQANTLSSQFTSGWYPGESSEFALASWEQSAQVYAVGGSASSSPSELIASFTASSPVPVTIVVSRTLVASAGALVPSHSIDIFDDGLDELTVTGPASVAVSATLGPQPLRVRLRSHVTQTGVGSVNLDLRVRVEPGNNLMIQPVVQPCVWDIINVYPSFVGSGIQCSVFTANPTVIVFGLGAQPLLLPPLSTSVQCQLLPSVDFAAFVPFSQPLELALPAPVRPVTLWIQGLALTPNGLATSNALTVIAW
jgi:hypothetical protein